MPKLKTKGAVKKRFKRTANGKIKSRKAGTNHLNSKHSKKSRRRKKSAKFLKKPDEKRVKKLMH
ncbi:MAG: 50S ribosomal protein L35 [Acidobacteriota bacterium]|nr:50S ribosomal protein L35 [Acidobacteriota bacterium]